MHYTPHILQKANASSPQEDEYGRVVAAGVTRWENVCRCRCDSTEAREMRTADGNTMISHYRVICDSFRPNVKPGDMVRCVLADGSVKAEARVISMKILNRLPYVEINL